MAYLEEIRSLLNARNFKKLLEIWEEYCASDVADGEEIVQILEVIKVSEFAKHFGQIVEAILPLIDLIKEEKERQDALRLVFDIETTNTPKLYDMAIEFIKKHFEKSPLYAEKFRLIGLRPGENFQGALSNFMLLNHMEKGNFVLHTAGWGVGEIMDVSFLREQASIEFEHLQGSKRDISFKNAFKTLIPIPKTHFLARRFSGPDNLEKDAKENSVEIVRQLLQDLGPKTASEIKDEMVDLVIPEAEYSKWWQQARAKLKKDPLIETPDATKEPFKLRKGHASWEERLEKAFAGKNSFEGTLSSAHSLVRDFPELLKNPEAKARLIEKIQNLLLREKINEAEHLQVLLFLENPLGVQLEESSLKKLILKLTNIEETLNHIEIVQLKKRLLTAIREYRSDWAEIFLQLLFVIEPNQLKDFLVKELTEPTHLEMLKKRIKDLIDHPRKYPEAVLWYFQKVLNNEDLPFFSDTREKSHSLEALLIVFNSVDHKAEYKDLSKKIYNLLTGNRFEIIRNFLKECSKDFAEEFLLLSSKCHGFSDHDKKILRSLTEVAHPSLAEKKQQKIDFNVFWTTEAGYFKMKERVQHIGTVEIVDVAKEIEVARSHGDLRENAEYKSALERRARLQNELKMLSDQFQKARILTKDDVSVSNVGIGTKIELMGPKGEKIIYSILGPWDADPDSSILSFQSKFAQAMEGKKAGEKFSFKGDEFKILTIKSFFEE
jgi:transcription elongation factor GreA-like protein/transcription elongation GreA/GreB family factor